ncbi:hypothetical protein EST38_g9514 [Candolleomyces aberdarensis]|uniref:Uncharacterized protein n=1 Tax=Candolleomyces aberdarensis TaxID=2316362 RepID=A0A4Q2DCN3_9AGAR|nr:hypothetical protein EST38_g9514 [Candolleomyces aberdarensis]
MSAIEVYTPVEPELHLTLPHDHANSVHSTSPFIYKLDEEFDFVEILPTSLHESSGWAMDSFTVAALTWAAARTKQVINRATRGVVPSVAVNAPIPDYMFKNLGMKKPHLVALLEGTSINPLLNIAKEKVTLKRLYCGLQQLGREAIDWITKARWRSVLMGDRSLWDWEDPRVLRPLEALVDDHRAIRGPPVQPAALASGSVTPTPSSPAGSTIVAPPSSPTTPVLPFGPVATPVAANVEDDIRLLLQLVLHPTASRYALRYPLVDVFNNAPHVNNGYVDSDSEDAMDVDSE